MHELRRRLFRFAVVGIGTNGFAYVCYLALTWLGMGPKLAMTLLYLAVVLVSFYYNRMWSFRHEGDGRIAFIRYCAVYATGYVVNFAMLWIGVDIAGLPHAHVQAVAVVVVASLAFATQQWWVFAQKRGAVHDADATAIP